LRVAIVGAGIAGLSCAYELKKQGITTDIFDRKDYLEQSVDFNTCTLKLFDRSHLDPIKYLRKKYGLKLDPAYPLTEIIMNAPSKRTVVRGKLGYIFVRGDFDKSLENQVYTNSKVSITFQKHIEVEKIKKDYEYVVDASGNIKLARKLNVWTPTLNAFTRIAVVSGKFKTGSLTMWVNTEYCRNAFAFQIAHSSEKACLVLTVNDITHSELDYYWEKFLIDENIRYTIIKTSDVENNLGFAQPARVDNVFIIGRAGGFIDSVLGFGMINCIESGIYAARAIAKGFDYNKLIIPIMNNLKNKHEFRKILNTFGNQDYDKLVTLLGLPGVKHAIYNNPLAKITHATFLAKAYNKLNES